MPHPMETTMSAQMLEGPSENDTYTNFAYSMRAKIKRRAPLEILLVEDDPSDVMLTEYALDETYIPHRLHTVVSGEEVLSYLRREDQYANAPVPDLILLDLSLPRKDGFEVLAELTQEATFAKIPIIILTGAQHYQHILHSYSLWLSDYVPKPCSPDKLLETFGKLHSPKKAA